MARWSSTTWEQYVAAFRSGARRGRTSWLQVFLGLTQYFAAGVSVNVWRAAVRHGLDERVAWGDVQMLSVALLVMAMLLTFSLRTSSLDRVKVFWLGILSCGFTGSALFLCFKGVR